MYVHTCVNIPNLGPIHTYIYIYICTRVIQSGHKVAHVGKFFVWMCLGLHIPPKNRPHTYVYIYVYVPESTKAATRLHTSANYRQDFCMKVLVAKYTGKKIGAMYIYTYTYVSQSGHKVAHVGKLL